VRITPGSALRQPPPGSGLSPAHASLSCYGSPFSFWADRVFPLLGLKGQGRISTSAVSVKVLDISPPFLDIRQGNTVYPPGFLDGDECSIPGQEGGAPRLYSRAPSDIFGETRRSMSSFVKSPTR